MSKKCFDDVKYMRCNYVLNTLLLVHCQILRLSRWQYIRNKTFSDLKPRICFLQTNQRFGLFTDPVVAADSICLKDLRDYKPENSLISKILIL